MHHVYDTTMRSDLTYYYALFRIISMTGTCAASGPTHRGKGVIGALPFVDMVIGVYRLVTELATSHLNGPVGDDLIGIHVALSATASLPYHQREVVQKLAFCHLCCCLHHCIPNLRVQHLLIDVDLHVEVCVREECSVT